MASVVSTDGRVEVSSIPTTTSTGITDMVHGVVFSMTLLTGAQAATIGRPGNKFKVTVSQINSDYVDTGYTVPIFARDTDLTTKITETIW